MELPQAEYWLQLWQQKAGTGHTNVDRVWIGSFVQAGASRPVTDRRLVLPVLSLVSQISLVFHQSASLSTTYILKMLQYVQFSTLRPVVC
jgi:hypothetical protein